MIKNKILLHKPTFIGNELKYLKECIKTEWVASSGGFIEKFEKKIKKFTGSKYAVSCASGTSALHIALKVNGIEKNDEVIIPSLTFIAPVNSIIYNFANPIFFDSNNFFTINTEDVINFLKNNTKTIYKKNKIKMKKTKVCINKKTGKIIKAILVVHVFGNAVFLDEIKKICKLKNIKIIEDAAESLGTFYKQGQFKGKHTGTVGDAGCLSFNGNKIVTSGGGGMILTNNKKIYKSAKYYINQAKDNNVRYIHNNVGYNYRLTNLQAALGLAQIENIKKFIKAKKFVHRQYIKLFSSINGLEIVKTPLFSNNNIWLNILRINKKIFKIHIYELILYLEKFGIQTRPIWHLNHLQKPFIKYENFNIKNDQKLLFSCICLPSSPDITKNEINFIYNSVIKALKYRGL